MIIEKKGNSIVFTNKDCINVYPMNTIILISNDESDAINVRLRASRKNVLSFLYKDVENITATSANDMAEKIGNLSNKY